ncbi:IclR family transcriptional regulator [Glaciibacter superstes]|uniref:IclR family transcriptional regulator n=1 Tax=Glaciibacter superstes TaxID=501023 RepID=UPI0003B3DB7A|nr:IclR family transcriptional regulator [Glaciibacter superstes]
MATNYAVPALDKALDILELLAGHAGGLGQAQVAEAVGRTVGEIFRVLQTLERRGFILRERQSGLYVLSTRMLELANQHPPLRGLVQAASDPMRRFAQETRQSCNLSTLESTVVRVIAHAESPADFGFRVRVGAGFPAASTSTGIVLLAFAEPDTLDFARAELAVHGTDLVVLDERIAAARERGWASDPDPRQEGILDIVYPVFGRSPHAVAAFTVPYLATSYSEVDAGDVLTRAAGTAAEISRVVQGGA